MRSNNKTISGRSMANLIRRRSARKVKRLCVALSVAGAGLLGAELFGPGASQAHAQSFLQIDSLGIGTTGFFAGSLGVTSVYGVISTPNPNFQFEPTGAMFDSSAMGPLDPSLNSNLSPQYSYASVYSPSTPLTDQVGYNYLPGNTDPATITISFTPAVTNPVFQVANLDSMEYDFSPTPNLTLQLIRGNGGPIEPDDPEQDDGLMVSGTVISDADPYTVVGQDPTDAPFTTGPRSAYGSVEFVGSFSTVTLNVYDLNSTGDGGSFTLSTVPEPSSLAVLGAGAMGLGIRRRRAAARVASVIQT